MGATAATTTVAYCRLEQGDSIHLEAPEYASSPGFRCLATAATVLASSNGTAVEVLGFCTSPSALALPGLLPVRMSKGFAVTLVCIGLALLGLTALVYRGMHARRRVRNAKRRGRKM